MSEKSRISSKDHREWHGDGGARRTALRDPAGLLPAFVVEQTPGDIYQVSSGAACNSAA